MFNLMFETYIILGPDHVILRAYVILIHVNSLENLSLNYQLDSQEMRTIGL